MLLSLNFATAQSSITVKFTATTANGTYCPLDEVNVTNVTQGWNQTLVYPDTTLVLNYTDGVSELANEGGLSQNHPNPFYGSTEADLVVAESGNALLRLIRLDGKVIAERSATLEAGEHRINVTMADVQMAFLHVATADRSYVIKLLNLGHGGNNSIEVNRVVKREEKPTRDVGIGAFELGDMMRYTGMVMQNGNMVSSNTVSKAQYNSENITLVFNALLPTVVTSAVTDIAQTTATGGGNVTSDGGSSVTERGVCWNTTHNPTMKNSHTTSGSGIGSFTANITGLTTNRTYYVRAYATNSAGTAYGNEVSFTSSPKFPTVTTKFVTNIGQNAATCGGNVTSNGGAALIARGVCWSTSPNPTIDDSHTTDGTVTGGFTSNLTGLTANTTYYVRAYATNSAGTAYGDERVFTTLSSLPVVTTSAVTNIAQTTATCGGNVTSEGGASVTARGVCWSTSPNPTIGGSHTTNGTGTGSFTSSITGLTSGTTYYVRAYATNSNGTAYGEEKSFTTTAATPTVTTNTVSNVTTTTATCGGNVTSDGGASVTARGVCWATTQNPTVSGSHTTNGTGTGSFTSSISGLSKGTTYYVRAYATNSKGTSYGEQKTFTTSTSVPTVTTNDVSNVTTTTATCGGNVTDNGGASVTARGVCWSTSQNPTVSGSHTTDGTGTGTFTSNLTGLTANTTYYVRAYATNSKGTSYGEQKTFTTSTASVPTVTTNSVSNVTTTTATCGGNVTSDEGASVTARGVCWSTMQNPKVSGSHTTNGTGTGSFTSSITGLYKGTTYYVRAYATNSKGTSYGEQKTFTTSTSVPIVTTNDVSNITATTATCGGNVTDNGGASVTARGVCWSTSQNPTVSDSHTTNGTGTGTFTSSLTGLTNGTTYYVRAYATNSKGTSYGEQKTFTAKHEYVDLGLPSGILWATCNVGANSPGGYGDYFAWGETEPQANNAYSWSSYKYTYRESGKITKYCNDASYGYNGYTDNLTCLLPEDDAASTNWGGRWRMPTKEEWEELISNTTSTWTSQNGVKGRLFTASNGNTLFLPHANRCVDGWTYLDNECYYWSSSLSSDASRYAWSFYSYSGTFGMNRYVRYVGHSVRPVCDITLVAVLPTVTTNAVSDVTPSTATCGGNVTNDGGAIVTARGVCWSTSRYPTISGSHTTNGTGTSSFTSSITGLTSGTTYYVRAYATNSNGTAYGEEKSFTITAALTVTTNRVSNITTTTAICGGNVIDDEDASVTARGVCWSTTQNPTVSSSHTTDGTGTGSFTSSITGLSKGTTYYVRAYATSSNGTSYGEQNTFKTKDYSIIHEYVDLGLPSGTLWATSNVGANAPEEYGDYFAWGETDPQSDNAYNWDSYKYYDGNNLTKYTGSDGLTTLEASDDAATANWGGKWRMPTGGEWEELYNNTTRTWTTQNGVYGRLFTASNGNSIFLPAAGSGYWSASLDTYDPNYAIDFLLDSWGSYCTSSFYRIYGLPVRPVWDTSLAMAFLPTVTTNAMSVVMVNTATCGGNVASDGGSSVIARGVCWSTNENPTIGDCHTTDGYGTGTFTSNLTGLTNRTTYYVRAYAINSNGISYGEQKTFKTTDYSINYVDLGLPSGTLWAACNVGANAPEEYGDYFAWGETEPQANNAYNLSSYKYANGNYQKLTKYCNNASYGDNGFTDNLTCLLPEDDAATADLGGMWRMPTEGEWQELRNNTTSTWTTQNGVNGYLLTASNGNSIFLPAAGWRRDGGLYSAGSYGYYWSSSLHVDFPDRAWYLFFSSGYYYMNGDVRSNGFSVRPVYPVSQK